MTTPTALTRSDWKKLIEIPQVIETWELDQRHSVELFSSMVYGAKFVHTDAGGKITHTLFVLTEGTSYGFNLLLNHNQSDDRFCLENYG
jgi:hypothetical protein